MSITAPHYLLLSDTQSDNSDQAGGWSFVLERVDGSGRIEVADQEPDVRGERLQLLAIVRGLEALEQPSKVTLITPSRFIGRGIRNGINVWRENQWQWERFGAMAEIKNADLWRRIDRAKSFHQIDCRVWNFKRILGNLELNRNRISLPRINPPKSSKPRQLANSWTEIAATVANRILPAQSQQVYGCA